MRLKAFSFFRLLHLCFIYLQRISVISLEFLGGSGIEVTPVPIPNTAVKLFSADGTAVATPWESRSPPGIYIYEGV